MLSNFLEHTRCPESADSLIPGNARRRARGKSRMHLEEPDKEVPPDPAHLSRPACRFGLSRFSGTMAARRLQDCRIWTVRSVSFVWKNISTIRFRSPAKADPKSFVKKLLLLVETILSRFVPEIPAANCAKWLGLQSVSGLAGGLHNRKINEGDVAPFAYIARTQGDSLYLVLARGPI